MFVDTDLNVTRSYSKFLLNKELITESHIEEANQFDLYIFLEKDSLFIQDGTRLDKQRHDELQDFHKTELISRGVQFKCITGSWEEKYAHSIEIIDKLLNP